GLANYLSPSNQDWAPWPVKAIRGGLAALAAPGDVYSGRLPIMESSGRTNPEAIGRMTDLAGLMMLGTTGAPRGSLGSGFVRRTSGDTPYNDAGHMMFVEEGKLDSLGPYGRNLWHFESNDVPSARIMQADDSSF